MCNARLGCHVECEPGQLAAKLEEYLHITPTRVAENTNPFVKYLTCKPSCLEGEPEFVMLFNEEELEEEIDVIDPYLGGMVLGKPFVKESKHIYDKEEGTIMFEKNDERITFKMPHKMERFKDIEDLNTDKIPPFFVTSKGDEEKGEVMLVEKG
nr:hypothetical protein [Tanacetum cinerariifolium]